MHSRQCINAWQLASLKTAHERTSSYVAGWTTHTKCLSVESVLCAYVKRECSVACWPLPLKLSIKTRSSPSIPKLLSPHTAGIEKYHHRQRHDNFPLTSDRTVGRNDHPSSQRKRQRLVLWRRWSILGRSHKRWTLCQQFSASFKVDDDRNSSATHGICR